jgi:DNA-binding transcriptional ArsR family regulator
MMTLNVRAKNMTEETPIDPVSMASAAAQASELMKTLGHKDRLMVLCHLSSGEKSVNLVKTRREAQTIYYSIASREAERMVQLMHELYCSQPEVRLAG